MLSLIEETERRRHMKLHFLGTRGYLRVRSERHYMHASLQVSFHGRRVILDLGEDWLGKAFELAPAAYFVTHAHPDHAWGLKRGAPCPVYASADSWESMSSFAVEDRRVVTPREPVTVGGFTFEAFKLEHSIRAPAVGYRVTAGTATIFYAPDLVYIEDRAEALAGADRYIGDGATLERSMVRKRGDVLFGHTPMRTQLTWCEKEGVRASIFTHCGAHIVAGDEESVAAKLEVMARERGVATAIAHDGLDLEIRGLKSLGRPGG